MILIFIIAVSLSMDAFSLSLAYGTLSFSKKERLILANIVGIYHFFMPIFGMLIGQFLEELVNINNNMIMLIIFLVIGFNMIVESFKKDNSLKQMKLVEMIVFGFAVSIDSFSLGIGINNISNNFILCSIIFSIISFLFTYIGLFLGNKLNQLIGNIATILGGITLIILGISYVL